MEYTAQIKNKQPEQSPTNTTKTGSMITSTSSKFERKEYIVTDLGCQLLLCLTCPLHYLPLVPGLMGTKTMVLEEEEAVLKINCQPFCTINTRRPYGELGSVDSNSCLCCTGVSSNLSKSLPIYIGWGCDDAQVEEVVTELRQRMKARGDTGQIARTEETLLEIKQLRQEMEELKSGVRIILRSIGGNEVPASVLMDR